MKKWIAGMVVLVCFMTGYSLYAQTYRVSVNQFVEHPALDAVLKGFQDQLKEQGLDVKYKIHNAQANMGTATQIANQILGENPDIVLAIATPSAQASAQALKKAPADFKATLLFSAITDPVSAGLVSNLEAPGGRITGVSDMTPMAQHISMIKQFYPDMQKLGVMYNAGEANSKVLVKMMEEQSKVMGFQLVSATASKSSEVYQAAKGLVGRVDAVYIPTDNTIVAGLEAAIKVGIQHKLPIFAGDVDSVKRGAVAAMGFDYYKHGVQTGAMAAKILKGQNPATTSVEMQEKLLLHINKTYAAKMGVTIPKAMLTIADEVHE